MPALVASKLHKPFPDRSEQNRRNKPTTNPSRQIILKIDDRLYSVALPEAPATCIAKLESTLESILDCDLGPIKARSYFTTAGKVLTWSQAEAMGHFLSRVGATALVELQWRLRGGKGGYGAMMKNEAANKKKFEDCYNSKDIKGRRIRDIRNEVRLRKWIKKNKHAHLQTRRDTHRFDEYKDQMKQQKLTLQIQQEQKQFKASDRQWGLTIASSIKKAKLRKKLVRKNVDQARAQTVSTQSGSANSSQAETREKEAARFESKDETPKAEADLERKLLAKPSSNVEGDKDSKLQVGGRVQSRQPVKIELDAIASREALSGYCAEDIKFTLKSLGLKCGGRPDDRAQRLWDVAEDPALMFTAKYRAKRQRT